MAIVEMQKVHIAALAEYKDQILETLKQNEIIHIQNIRQSQMAKEDKKYEYELAEIKASIHFLESISGSKKSFIETFIPPKDEISEEALRKTSRKFNLAQINRQRREFESNLHNLKNLKHELETEHERLLPWQSLDVPLKDLVTTNKTSILLGKIRTKKLQEFKNRLGAISAATHVIVANQTREDTYLALIYLTSENNTLTEFITKSELSEVSLPTSQRSPAQEIVHICSLIKETDEEIEEVKDKAKKLAQNLTKLKYMYDYVLDNKVHLEAKQNLLDTAYTFIIEGWTKKNQISKLKTQIGKITKEFEVFEIEPAEGEKPPVVLKNPGFFSPFELITKIYGTPKSDELDPTLPLSLFFAFFFGLCLGDFGYGVILAAISIYFLKRYKLPEGGRNLFRLLILGGGVSCAVGILTGTYLGFTPKEIPTTLLPLKEFLLSLQIIDPIKSPLVMLVFSLALGVIQIFFGIFLQMAYNIKNKRFVAAILDDGLWIFFLGSILFLIISPSTLASRLSITGGIALVLTQGRHKKNVIQKFFSGLLSLYKVSGYMGDTLSYSRLLALGMSSAIIGSVINILAGMVKGGVPVFGVVLMVILLIFGHLFNLIISTLGAFVHSTRLQMVEFFSKFYEGGGKEFRPYKRVAEYTILK